MFCPPRLPMLPPTNAICAVPHHAPNSPTTLTRSTRGAEGGGGGRWGVGIGEWGLAMFELAGFQFAAPTALPLAALARTERCPPLPRDARRVQQFRHRLEPVGMTRHQHQPQLWPLRTQRTERLQRHCLFRLLRAAGQQHDVILRKAGQCGQPPRGRIVAIGLRAVVFHRAGDVDRFRPAPSVRNRSA